MKLKFSEKKSKICPKLGKKFFLRVIKCEKIFHLMHQSKLKVRANKQFLLVANDAQRTGGRFLNHSSARGEKECLQ